MVNPYLPLYHWAKGELYDIEAIQIALNTRDRVNKQVKANEKKKQNTMDDIDNVQIGKKTMTTLFKNEGDTDKLLEKVEQTEKEIENLVGLNSVIVVYLGTRIIPDFKAKHIKVYKQILEQFNVLQVKNSHK